MAPSIISGDRSPIFSYSISHWYSSCIYVAAHLSLADELQPGPKHIDELAATAGCDPQALYRMLRVLVSIDLFTEQDGFFRTTPLGDTLRRDHPESIRAWVLTAVGYRMPLWQQLHHSVKTGHTAFSKVYGAPVWEYYQHNREESTQFIKAMENLTAPVIRRIIDEFDFSSYPQIVDVGGGNGTLLLTILQAFSGCKGIVFDAPHVAAEAEKKISAAGLNASCTAVPGNFFESVPTGDLLILKNILHDWNDSDAIRILQVCAAAMTSESVLLILEAVIPEGATPFVACR